MPKPFDITSKHLVEFHPRDWLAWAGWPVPDSDAAITIVDADLSVVSYAADKLIRVDHPAGAYIAHFEFQTTGDPTLDRRMLAYNALARLRHQLPVRSVAFLFRSQASAGPTGLVSEHVDARSWIDFSYRLIRIWELPLESLLNGPVGILPLAPLAAELADLPEVVNRIAGRLRAEVSPEETREMLQCTRLLMGMRFDGQLVESIMASLSKVLEDSSTYQLTLRRGFDQGVAQGVAQGQRQVLLELGTEKFGPPSEAVEKRLLAFSDPAELKKISKKILQATAWAELFDVLD
jgi:predicted transposase YdaD